MQRFATSNLRSQVGALPDHSPSSWHVLVDCPSSVNPSSQEYVAVESTIVPVRSTSPFVGLARFPQSTATVKEMMKSLQCVGMLASSWAYNMADFFRFHRMLVYLIQVLPITD